MTAAATSNPFGYTAGNCTWWVNHLAPWIDSYGNFGDAHNWLSHAASQGLSTGRAPQPGAIAVWGSNAPGSGGYGHVALVTGVQANGLPVVSEMNYRGLGLTDNRNVDAGSAQYITGYIYPPSSALQQSSLQAAGSAGTGATTFGFPSLDQGTSSSGWSVGPFEVLSGTGVHRLLFTLSGVALLGIGVWILFRKEVAGGIRTVARAVPV